MHSCVLLAFPQPLHAGVDGAFWRIASTAFCVQAHYIQHQGLQHSYMQHCLLANQMCSKGR
jgi:hypothetical protein